MGDHEQADSLVPPFRADGYLPEGLFRCTEAELTFRFGSANRRRRRLILRVRRWILLTRSVRARRLLIDGSFVTAKPEPEDVDAVVLLPTDFEERIEQGDSAALELEQMLLSRMPEEIWTKQILPSGYNSLVALAKWTADEKVS